MLKLLKDIFNLIEEGILMNNFGTGMKTYERILQDSRIDGKAIGPQHHLHDSQRKDWEKNNPEPVKPKIEELKAKINKAVDNSKKAADSTKKVIASVKIKPLPTKDSLMKKFKEEKIKKLGDALKFDDRCSHIKSSGNGL